MNHRIVAVFGAIVAISSASAAQQAASAPPLTQKLGVDSAVRIGTLPNGLRYYIRKNVEPAKRAELRLVVNAGSTLEDEDQLGYAHFIEHMAFNGTTHFKKNDLVKYLQSIGVRFGADLNAYTSFDETVYQLSVPTDTARQLETAFLILEDWAHGQLFDSTEVVNERGVVQEEWRSSLGAGERMQRVFIPIILKGSKYAVRVPIGTQESILRAQPSVLRRFYHDWYRPDLMAVVAVGDFDVAQIEATIKQHFSGIPAVPSARPRMNAAVPGNTQPLVAILTDVEATSSNVTIGFKHPAHAITTVGEYRTSVIADLYFTMINARLEEIAHKPDAPFLGAGVSNGAFFARDVEAFTFGAGVKDGGIERGAEAVLAEARRVDQFGFLPSELQRAKQSMLREWEQAYAERAKTNSSDFVGELVRNYLVNEDIPGVAAEYRLRQQLLPGIALTDVNKLASDWITDDNRIVLATAPQKAGVTVPTEAQMLAVIDRANHASVTAYTETVADAPLIPALAAPGKVTATRSIPSIGVTEWTLSNGARVLLKPTDFKADEVIMSAYGPGGLSLIPDKDFMSGWFATNVMDQSGWGSYNSVDLQKKLSNKLAGVSEGVGTTEESLGGSASPQDLETMFQLLHLRFTGARLDTAAWLALKGQAESFLANRGASPRAVWQDTITVTMGQHDFRSRPLTLATFAEIDPQRALALYKERFANAGGFTFVFVGAFKLDSIKPLVEKYLASLPGNPKPAQWKNVSPGPPAGVVEKVVRKGTEPQAQTLINFTGPFTYTPQTRFDMLAMTTLAQMWLIDALREDMGGTYSPSLSGAGAKIPRTEYGISVQFTSSPDNVEKLSARLFKVIDSLQKHGPTDADVTKVRETIRRTRETQLKTNGYWAGNLTARDEMGEDIAGLGDAYDAMLKNLTGKQIQDAAKLYFDVKRYVKVVLLPEKQAQ